jgi:hypothetical protein
MREVGLAQEPNAPSVVIAVRHCLPAARRPFVYPLSPEIEVYAMPNILILNWNIEKLSTNKTGMAGMATNMGKVIATAHNPGGAAPVGADIAIILEVSQGTAIGAMTAVAAAATPLAWR